VPFGDALPAGSLPLHALRRRLPPLRPLPPFPCLHARPRAQVWDFSRSADARDTEGGASKRSLVQQVEKMRKYLADTA
jgi:hypothetical protein